MNRLKKILTLGLEKKRAWQLPVIKWNVFGLGNSKEKEARLPLAQEKVETGEES